MFRLAVFAGLALAAVQNDAAQNSSVLHIRMSVVTADQRTVPVARHALLVGEDPPSAAPRRVVTTADGTADIRLRPGRYMVESERPSIFAGRAYQWTRTVDVLASRETTLELTAANAEVTAAAPGSETPQPEVREAPAPAPAATTSERTVEIWTEYRHAGGTLVSRDGLVATTEAAIGSASSIEVQLSPAVKVGGVVLATDSAHDVAIVRIDPAAVTDAQSLPAGCELEPVVCAVAESARRKIDGAAMPSAAHLPVEPPQRLPAEMTSADRARGLSVSSYAISTSDFDITFITPNVIAAAEARARQERTGGVIDSARALRTVTDFGEWSGYVSSRPPVVFVRATPKLVESFWMKLARGAAATQGSSIPPITHVGPGFSRMRVLCGDKEVIPVHPFKIQMRVSDKEAVEEGFYAFDPLMLGPQCGSVSIVLSSVKDPAKTETRVISPAIVAQVWKDFEPYWMMR